MKVGMWQGENDLGSTLTEKEENNQKSGQNTPAGRPITLRGSSR
jgi:hypothetical protein